MGHLGYVEGICRIFLRGLRGVEVTKRPFHCSDVKRETMFVKDLAGNNQVKYAGEYKKPEVEDSGRNQRKDTNQSAGTPLSPGRLNSTKEQ